MKLPAIWGATGLVDARRVRRDAMLRWMIFLPILITFAIRLLLPEIITRLAAWVSIEVHTYYLSLMSALFFVLVPFIWGMLSGFLLLDERDDRTLSALQVTPLHLSHYLLYRLALPSLLSVASTALLYPFAGLMTLPGTERLLLALAAAPLAPLIALLLAALAQNKVQGLAMTKASGLLILPALAAALVPFPWRWLFAPIPTFWPTQAVWQALEGGSAYAFFLVGGFVFQMLFIVGLARRFQRIMHR